MLNSLKVRFGFSIKNQISFLLALSVIREKDESLELVDAINSLETDFPFLVGVIKKRINDGATPVVAIAETLDKSLDPYVKNDDLFLSATGGICRILLSHHSMFVRRLMLSFTLVGLSLLGIVIKEPSMAIGASACLLLIEFLCKPIAELHKESKII